MITTFTYDSYLFITKSLEETNGTIGFVGIQTDDTFILANTEFLM